MDSRREVLDDYPIVITLPVVWSDEDSFRHVNNTVYLRWAESARIEYLQRIGLWETKPGESVGPIVAALSCDYRHPLKYPDEVRIGTNVTAIGNSSFRMNHRIVSVRLGIVAADVQSALVVLDYRRNKPVRVPEPVRQAIQEIEGRVLV